jgi:hypothetical protein
MAYTCIQRESCKYESETTDKHIKSLRIHFGYNIKENEMGWACRQVVPVPFFLTKHHTIKVYWESGDIAPFIL